MIDNWQIDRDLFHNDTFIVRLIYSTGIGKRLSSFGYPLCADIPIKISTHFE